MIKRKDRRKTKESEVSPEVIQALQASGCHLFRNTRGVTKYGDRWVRFGVGPNGAGDFIGFLPVRITKEMVGAYIAVFVSAETKRPIGGAYEKGQIAWRDMVLAAGGIAGFCRSWEDSRALVNNFFAKFKKKLVAKI